MERPEHYERRVDYRPSHMHEAFKGGGQHVPLCARVQMTTGTVRNVERDQVLKLVQPTSNDNQFFKCEIQASVSMRVTPKRQKKRVIRACRHAASRTVDYGISFPVGARNAVPCQLHGTK